MEDKKSNLLSVIVVASFTLFCLASCSDEASVSWQEKLKKYSQENKFACLLVDNEKDVARKAIRNILQKVVSENTNKVGIIEADFKKNKGGLEKFFNLKLKDPPAVLVVAPNGALTGMFEKTIDKKKIQQSLVPPEEADLILSLQNGQAVFLCFYKQQSDELERVKSKLGDIERFFKGKAVAQYLNINETSELALVKRLPPFNHDSVTVFSVVPPGRVRSKLEGAQIKRANLLKAFQSCCPTSSGKGSKDCK